MRILRVALVAVLAASCSNSGDDKGETAQPPPPPKASTSSPPPPPPAEPTSIDACAVLPLEDAQAIAATKLQPGQAGNPNEPSCMYTGDPSGPTAQVEIYVGDGAQKMLDIDRELKHEFTAVPDIAEEAHAEENAIFFRKGTVWVAIRLVRLNDAAENREPLVKAARAVASRL